MQVITDDDLVAVPFESLTGFGEEEVLVRFKLFYCLGYERVGLDVKKKRTNLEGDNEASWGPFIHHWL